MLRPIWIISVFAAALVGCDRDMRSEKGFALPKGDPVAGREAFAVFRMPYRQR